MCVSCSFSAGLSSDRNDLQPCTEHGSLAEMRLECTPLNLRAPQQSIKLVGYSCVKSEHTVGHLRFYSVPLNKYSVKEEQESCTRRKLPRTDEESPLYSLLSSSPMKHLSQFPEQIMSH